MGDILYQPFMYFHGYIADTLPYIDCQQIKANTKIMNSNKSVRQLHHKSNLCLFTNPTQMLHTNPLFKCFPNYRHKRLTSISRAEAPSS